MQWVLIYWPCRIKSLCTDGKFAPVMLKLYIYTYKEFEFEFIAIIRAEIARISSKYRTKNIKLKNYFITMGLVFSFVFLNLHVLFSLDNIDSIDTMLCCVCVELCWVVLCCVELCQYKIILYCFVSYRIIYHIISPYHITYHTISYHVISYHIIDNIHS